MANDAKPQPFRGPSHALLSPVAGSPDGTRKSRFAEVNTDDTVAEGLSVSMPPLSSKILSKGTGSSDSRISESKGPNLGASNSLDGSAISDEPGTYLGSTSKSSKSESTASEADHNRLSFASLFSLGSSFYVNSSAPIAGKSAQVSASSSLKSGQQDLIVSAATFPVMARLETDRNATTATDPVSVTTVSHTFPPNTALNLPPPNSATSKSDAGSPGNLPRLTDSGPDRRSRSRTQRRQSTASGAASAAASSTSPSASERIRPATKPTSLGKIGVCALDGKARSKPSRNILTRLTNSGEFEIIVFGDKVILDEAVENWPLCDFLISFFSDGFPLDKAIAYAKLRRPFCVNDLPMQKVLWDRRLCLMILDKQEVPTPQRIEINRDGGPRFESASLADHVYRLNGLRLPGPEDGTGGGCPRPKSVEMADGGDSLVVDGVSLGKPFVEKPTSGEDHNIRIYFPKDYNGGGGRRLFRKIGNKSSEWDKNLVYPRAIIEPESSYIYEKFLVTENSEDVKAYTVGADFCHAETRKSPVVDGVVQRNTHGKEVRYITALSKEEASMASRVSLGFGQRICGFDLLRAGDKSFVIDVNGWSFVKDNNEYYDKCASILRQIFLAERDKRLNHRVTSEKSMDQLTESTLSPQKKELPHRSTLKGLFRTPSLSKIRGMHKHGTASPELDLSTTPPTQFLPFTDRPNKPYTTSLPSLPTSDDTALPPPLLELRSGPIAARDSHSASALLHENVPAPASKHAWKLKGMVCVIRHADRTPKQKLKFTFHTQPFIDLLKGHQEEVLLKGEAALASVSNAVKLAMEEGIEDKSKLSLLKTSLSRKGAWTGTKVQIKPMFRKRKAEVMTPISMQIQRSASKTNAQPQEVAFSLQETNDPRKSPGRKDSLTGMTLSRFSAAENDLILDKLQLIIKWGGEPTHSARYQSQDLGENMRNDLFLMNREVMGDVNVFSSSEPRVSTSAQIWAASFLDQKDVPDSFISVRKDLLDDSNAAKDEMDRVKKKLKTLLREGHDPPPQFAWPLNMPEPASVVRKVAELMRFHRRVLRHNFNKLGNGAAASLNAINQPSEDGKPQPSGTARALAQAQAVASIQARWCCGEDPELFKERWEKLFAEFTDAEKVDPSKISELYDSMKFDALHNRQFLEWVFTPRDSILEEMENEVGEHGDGTSDKGDVQAKDSLERRGSNIEKVNGSSAKHRITLRRQSYRGAIVSPLPEPDPNESYFKLFQGNGQTKAKRDARLEKLRELYQCVKVLFDFVCPQEYGISDNEKLEIGLLTSLPLLKEIVQDLEEVQASESPKSFFYFTKESHVYTLLNCILEGDIETKIARNKIPELDYLSQIVFELYESEDKEAGSFTYSIRIVITPGCHTSDLLDLQLDSKHSIGCAPRRSLTNHMPWKQVIETLRAKFDTVKLPKSFLAINLSEKHARELQQSSQLEDEGSKEDV